jgi:hypothetical protein
LVAVWFRVDAIASDDYKGNNYLVYYLEVIFKKGVAGNFCSLQIPSMEL